MKNTIKLALAAAVIGSAVASTVTVARAASDGDELLSILGAGGGASATAPSQETTSALRKLLKTPTAEQNIFLTFFEKGEMEKSLYQWPAAFDGTEFAKSPSGKALNALVLYKNGIKVTGLESLLAIEKPEAIDSAVLTMWKEAAPDTDPTWSLVQVAKWNPAFTQAFGQAAEIRVRARQVYGSDEVAALTELIKKTQVDTKERAWLSWQLVLALSTGQDSGTAAKALAVLMKAPNNPVSQDLMTLTAARLLYQNGFLDAAQKYYEKVPKSSDHWFDAQEELGWTFIRKGEPQNTLAITKTLATPEFASQVGPEPLFLRSLAQLKVCDYPAVVQSLNFFRDRYKTRAKDLMAVSESADNKDVKAFIERSKKGQVTLAKIGASASKLPRYITRDEVLSQAVATEVALEKESKQAADLYARSLSGGTAQVGFQGRLEEFKKSVDMRTQSARSTTYNRVKALAQEEVNEIAQILQKLHIVEAELLQQISLANRVADASATQKASVKAGTTGSQAKDRLVFPAEQETWFDELANYKVDIKKGCQAAKR
jgi:tetratricopeptide (TPR) repeat protein